MAETINFTVIYIYEYGKTTPYNGSKKKKFEVI